VSGLRRGYPTFLIDATGAAVGFIGRDGREWLFPSGLSVAADGGAKLSAGRILYDDADTPQGLLVYGREFGFGAGFTLNTTGGLRREARPFLVSATGVPVGVQAAHGVAKIFAAVPTEGVNQTTVSAAVRVRISAGDGAISSNNVNSTRIREKATVSVTGPWIEVFNGYVNAALSTSAQEVAAVDPGTYRAAFLTNLGASSGAGLVKTGTITPLTWFGAGTCAPGFIWKLDGSAGDATSFAANGGAISGDGKTLTLPSGWYARSDAASGLTLLGEYMIQYEDGKPTPGTSRRGNLGLGMRADLGDANKVAAGAGVLVYALDWTGATSVTGTIMATPVAVFGTNAAGVKTGATAGDSLEAETGDFATGTTTLTGDADGCLAFANRALNLGGYSWVRTCIPGTRATIEQLYGGNAIRHLMMRYATWTVTDMGHNDRGMPWLGAVGTGYHATYQWYWNSLRGAMLGGTGRVISTDLLPKTTSTDTWATTANQTDNTGGVQYASINPFFQAGVFNVSQGDCDVAYSIYTATQNAGVLGPLGYNDIAAQKYPCFNGTANSGSRDGTHPGYGLLYQGIAAQMATQLPTLIGY
jgi:hypothetical protein